jgi:hypothetical protein
MGTVKRRAPTTLYDPKLLRTMLSAFASACHQLPTVVTSCELRRRDLARYILIHVDRGERNAQRLAYLASNDLHRHGVAAASSGDDDLGHSPEGRAFPSRSVGKQTPRAELI